MENKDEATSIWDWRQCPILPRPLVYCSKTYYDSRGEKPEERIQ